MSIRPGLPSRQGCVKRLNLIGAGRVGRTLALLWQRGRQFSIGCVLTRSAASARAAVTFIGAGRPVAALADMDAAEAWLLATPDRELEACSAALAQSGLLRAGDTVFHCSGALGTAELGAAAESGACVASVHPLKTFADPAEAVRTFAGTHCVAEGDAAAIAVLRPVFEAAGGRVSEIDVQHKALYHAASAIVCNCFTALLEVGLRGYAAAGIRRADALAMVGPLVRETVDNALRLGTAAALTGPVARGDADVVARHLDALDGLDPAMGELYRQLNSVVLELARAQGRADDMALDRIAGLLEDSRRGRLLGK